MAIAKRRFGISQCCLGQFSNCGSCSATGFFSFTWMGGDIVDVQARLPSIALTGFSCSPVALDLYRTSALALNSHTPFSGRPHLIASGTDNVRGIRIELYDMIAEMNLLEPFCIKFLDGSATENRSLRSHKNRVLREDRSDGFGIVVVVCFVFSFAQSFKRLS
jgi:hypothetical protein